MYGLTGAQETVKVFKSSSTSVNIGRETIPNIAVFKKGVKEQWGYEHVFEYVRPEDPNGLTRAGQILKKFPSFKDNDGVLKAVGETLEKGSKDGTKISWPFKNREGGMSNLEVNIANSDPGSINTLTIGDIK